MTTNRPEARTPVRVYAAFAVCEQLRETAIVVVLNSGEHWMADAMLLHETAPAELAAPLALSFGLDSLKRPCDVQVVANHECVPSGLRSAEARARRADVTWLSVDEALGETHALAECVHAPDDPVIRVCEEFARGAARIEFVIKARLDGLVAAAREAAALSAAA